MACMPLKQNIKMSMVTDYVENQPLWLKWYIALLFLKFIQAQLNRTFPTMDVNNQSILSFSASLFTYRDQFFCLISTAVHVIDRLNIIGEILIQCDHNINVWFTQTQKAFFHKKIWYFNLMWP
jgi:hypothetical protein